ncbi:hypothetical protein IJ596_08035 [bacterium]|nr:hypothetical protein [bacterium]
MTNPKNEKINIGCIKIFKLLTLLYEDRAYYKDVVEIFKDEIEEKSSNNIQVILNKNMNALRVFGIKIRKENNKYRIQNNLYLMNFSKDDIKSIHILDKAKDKFPDKTTQKDIRSFIKSLMLRMNNQEKSKLSQLKTNYDFSFYYSDLKQQIEKAEDLCKNHTHINLIYIKNNSKFECSGEAKEVLYTSKNVSLSVSDIVKNEQYVIPLSNILELKEFPSKSANKELTTTVVYKLKNRLAKTYKLKENEYSQGYDANGEQTIVCKNEPFDILLARLMRYSFNCEIISPKFLRIQMQEMIKNTLKNYEN